MLLASSSGTLSPMKHRVGIIGCGNISDTYLGIGAKFASLEVIAVADMDTAKRDMQAAKYGVWALEIDALLASDVDAIVNLTPPAAHASVTMQALEAGKHVYSEKPLAVSLEDGWAIRDLRCKRVCESVAPRTRFSARVCKPRANCSSVARLARRSTPSRR